MKSMVVEEESFENILKSKSKESYPSLWALVKYKEGKNSVIVWICPPVKLTVVLKRLWYNVRNQKTWIIGRTEGPDFLILCKRIWKIIDLDGNHSIIVVWEGCMGCLKSPRCCSNLLKFSPNSIKLMLVAIRNQGKDFWIKDINLGNADGISTTHEGCSIDW